ncbi:hypothetical protein LHGZ1_3102 [Laribacter hongkongensis]|uniref:Uncharacterized protein n=1 Tax=Laribacter hongkongensis TaxID=168471 RepID=A0A248LP34_9NEIS|nr:hypothetical protein LHGZ1_3102 [Laribacter hongkongensis]
MSARLLPWFVSSFTHSCLDVAAHYAKCPFTPEKAFPDTCGSDIRTPDFL